MSVREQSPGTLTAYRISPMTAAISDDNGTLIADAIDPVTATRLAACWNACRGITTEGLERIGAADGTDLYRLALLRNALDNIITVAAIDAFTERIATR